MMPLRAGYSELRVIPYCDTKGHKGAMLILYLDYTHIFGILTALELHYIGQKGLTIPTCRGGYGRWSMAQTD